MSTGTRATRHQRDLSGDGPPEPIKDKQELKIEFKEAVRLQQKLQTDITQLDDRLIQVQTDDRSSKAVLLEEKEALLNELGRLDSLVQTEEKKVFKMASICTLLYIDVYYMAGSVYRSVTRQYAF